MSNQQSLPTWQTSKTKELLYDDVVQGVLTSSMKPKVAQQTCPKYKTMDSTKFASCYCSMQQSVKKDKLCADANNKAATEFMNRRPAANIPIWNESVARQQLQMDVRNQNHLHTTPMELHASNPSYQEFSLDVFRNRVYKEVRCQKPQEKPKQK